MSSGSAEAVFLARDLINTPTNDMGPDALEAAVRTLADEARAEVSVDQGRCAAREEFPDDPCGRPRFGGGAAADRHGLGRRRMRPR